MSAACGKELQKTKYMIRNNCLGQLDGIYGDWLDITPYIDGDSLEGAFSNNTTDEKRLGSYYDGVNTVSFSETYKPTFKLEVGTFFSQYMKAAAIFKQTISPEIENRFELKIIDPINELYYPYVNMQLNHVPLGNIDTREYKVECLITVNKKPVPSENPNYSKITENPSEVNLNPAITPNIDNEKLVDIDIDTTTTVINLKTLRVEVSQGGQIVETINPADGTSGTITTKKEIYDVVGTYNFRIIGMEEISYVEHEVGNVDYEVTARIAKELKEKAKKKNKEQEQE